MRDLFNIFEGKHPKKNAIILIGASDSGKSSLADILCTPYLSHEIGNCKIPMRVAGNTFWLENLPGTEIYRCEEAYLDQIDLVQIMKSLLEGNANLEADVKYKSPITIPKRPVILTMNGKHRSDDVFFSSEVDAIANRSIILVMDRHISQRINDGSIALMKTHARYGLKVLYDKYRDTQPIIE